MDLEFQRMLRKEVDDDASHVPAGWAEALDRGINDIDQGRVTPVSAVIADLDVTLAEMADEETGDQVGDGEDFSNRTTTDRRPQS